MVVEIEVYEEVEKYPNVQAKYLVRGWDDVLWTDNLGEAVLYLKESIEKYNESEDNK